MKSPKIYIMVGRFNPPTKGHEYIINQSLKYINDDEHLFLFLSKKLDDKKNPLDVHLRGLLIRSLYQNEKRLIIRRCTDKMKCIMDILKAVNNLTDNVVLITGSDRKEEYEILLNKYNNIEYDFKSIEVIVFGDRNNADFVQSMSATTARNFALENDFENFSQCLSDRYSNKLKQHVFNLIRSKLTHTESEENEIDDDSVIDDVELNDLLKSLEQYNNYDNDEPEEYVDDYITLKL